MSNSKYIPSSGTHFRIKTPAALMFMLILSAPLFSQDNTDLTVPTTEPGFKCRAEVINGDTVPVIDLQDIYVYTEYVFKNKKHYEQWTRVKYNVKKVYPYAILAAAKLKEYDVILAKMPNEKMKKAYLRV